MHIRRLAKFLDCERYKSPESKLVVHNDRNQSNLSDPNFENSAQQQLQGRICPCSYFEDVPKMPSPLCANEMPAPRHYQSFAISSPTLASSWVEPKRLQS